MSARFFLGGHDLEMVTIRDLLIESGAMLDDKNLTWGARASAYRDEIEGALAAGQTPVLIELDHDLELPARFYEGEATLASLPRGTALRVDHHGPRAGTGTPTSLEQVFRILDLPRGRWTRRFDLVAANDRGHTRAMLALDPPATAAELQVIREADRRAQGVTPGDEADARAAIGRRELLDGGRLTVLRLATARTSAAADFMEPALGGPGFTNLLILSPGETNFFGEGRVVHDLAKAFPGGWYGGALPERGFWGHVGVDPAVVIAWVKRRCAADPAP